MYEEGIGAPRDYSEAVKWYRSAAEKSQRVHAFIKLSNHYYYGRKVPHDYAEAAKWIRKAAEQGFAPDQLLLGQMYAKGEGVPRDNILAYMWISLAASQGDAKAREDLDRLERSLKGGDLAQAQKIARDWRRTIPPPPKE